MTALHEKPTELMNRSMPPGVIIPELAYHDVRLAVDWLSRAFGFVERVRIGNHRAQLSFGDGAIIVTGRSDTGGEVSDAGSTHALLVRVANVDQHYEQAKQFGAWIVSPPTNYPYGERQYVARDIGRHRWTFSQTIADIDPKDWGGTLFE